MDGRATWLTVWGLMLVLLVPMQPQQRYDTTALNAQVIKLSGEGKYGEAIPIAERALAIREKLLGSDHIDVAQSLNNLAQLYQNLGRFAEAEGLSKRALAIREKVLGPNDGRVSQSLNNLAAQYFYHDRYAEAEPLFKRALAIDEKALGPDHPTVATTLNNLAVLFKYQSRYAEAEPLFKRALAIDEKALGPDHPDVGAVLNNLTDVYRALGHYEDAVRLSKRALAIVEKALGPDHPNVGTLLNNLGELYQDQGRYVEAEPLMKRAFNIQEKALGPDHPNVGLSLNNVALLYQKLGRYAEAETLSRHALDIQEKALGPDHPDIAQSIMNLGALAFIQQDWDKSFAFFERGSDIAVRRIQRGAEAVGQPLTGATKSKDMTQHFAFTVFIKSAYQRALTEKALSAELGLHMFQTAQWASSSEAAAAVAQMAARGATTDPKLGAIVRERQDLIAEWQNRDGARNAAVSQSPDKRDRQAETANVARLSDIDTRIREIDTRLATDAPDYAALASQRPLSIAEVQSQLADGEALVLFLDTPEWKSTSEETFIWAVTKTASRWVRIDLGTNALTERVAALRCGLDSTNWIDATKWPEESDDAKQRKEEQIVKRERCKTLTGADVSDSTLLPFDVAKANDLYEALFGQIADLLKNPDGTAKQLLIVPSGPLTQLPFSVLVTEKPEVAIPTNGADYAKAAWLIRRHAITVLPAAASLTALRLHVKTSAAAHPFVGFGNPLLTGHNGTDRRAWAKQTCATEKPQPEPVEFIGWAVPEAFASLFRGAETDVVPGTFANLFRGGVADVAALRRQTPLPETADELCEVSRELGATENDVYLGSRATETEIRRLNSDGTLAEVGVIQFATHGLIASETESVAKSLTEPALMLTPPDSATELDDGLLTASEVTELKLNADWIVLSACNTAAGGEKGNTEPLSGLARAFFYAGARALLVSHWSVDSRAAVKLTTGAFAELKHDPSIGRAEAMRRSMLAAMNDTERPKSWTPAAHPAVWAPFVVVGEGGATMPALPPDLETGALLAPATLPPSEATTPVPIQPESKTAALPEPSAGPLVASDSLQPAAPVAVPAVHPPKVAGKPSLTKRPATATKKKTLTTAPAKKADKDFDPDWNTKIFRQ